MSKNITLFKIKGLPVEISLNALLLLGLLALPAGFQFLLGRGGGSAVGLLIIMLGLLASTLVHELAHALVGIGFGSTVIKINLNLLGGVTYFAERPPDYFKDILIFLAGPASNLLLWQLFSGINGAGSLAAAFGYLATLNLLLGLFNALPAYPLDGGQAAYALTLGLTSQQKFAARVVLLFSFGIVLFMLFGPTGGWLDRDPISFVVRIWLAGWIMVNCLSLQREAAAVVNFYPSSAEQYNQFRKENGRWLVNRRSDNFFERGHREYETGQFELALGSFTQALELDPRNLNYLEQRAATYMQMGEFEQALLDYNELIKRNSKRADFYATRAQLYRLLGRTAQAQLDLTQALRLNPQDIRALSLQAELTRPGFGL